jgi:hypothetical protein
LQKRKKSRQEEIGHLSQLLRENFADVEKSNSDLENKVDFSALKTLYPSFLPS